MKEDKSIKTFDTDIKEFPKLFVHFFDDNYYRIVIETNRKYGNLNPFVVFKHSICDAIFSYELIEDLLIYDIDLFDNKIDKYQDKIKEFDTLEKCIKWHQKPRVNHSNIFPQIFKIRETLQSLIKEKKVTHYSDQITNMIPHFILNEDMIKLIKNN